MHKHLVVVSSRRDARILALQESRIPMDTEGPRLVELKTITNKDAQNPQLDRFAHHIAHEVRETLGLGTLAKLVLVGTTEILESLKTELANHPLRNTTVSEFDRNYATLDPQDLHRALAKEHLLPNIRRNPNLPELPGGEAG